jgi:NAD(P)-dependent dehydrogenase (short-subunit alcohol dehydrogenase family)
VSAVPYRRALIVGAGPGLGASLARAFAGQCAMRVAVTARRREPLEAIAAETGAVPLVADASKAADVGALFDAAALALGGAPDVVVYNASHRVRGPFVEVDAEAVARAVDITAIAAFRVAQRAVRGMLPNAHGAVFFTGASAGIKGFAHSAAFAMGKFALRGLAQSMARELAPQGIHVAHVVVDGAIRPVGAPDDGRDALLDPDAIAATYVHLLAQPRSAWSWEIEVRPWVEGF